MKKDPAKRVATFRYRVEIQNTTQVSDGQGGYVDTYATVMTVWCSLTPLSSYEKFQASQMQDATTHKIEMRYTDKINSDSRLVFDGRIFAVKEVLNEEERNRFLFVRAIENKSITT